MDELRWVWQPPPLWPPVQPGWYPPGAWAPDAQWPVPPSDWLWWAPVHGFTEADPWIEVPPLEPEANYSGIDLVWVPAPGWPPVPSGWSPPAGWVRPWKWPKEPPGWQFWQPDPIVVQQRHDDWWRRLLDTVPHRRRREASDARPA